MDKKEKVIAVARVLFTTYGYKKVSMDEIAKESGVTKRTIYTYFKDKDALFGYFILEERDKMRKMIEKVEKKNLSFFDTVHETLYTLLKYRKKSLFLNTIQREATILSTSPARTYLLTLEKETETYIRERLEKARQEEWIKPCNIDLCAFIILKIYMAIMLEWDMDQKPLKEKEITDSLTMILKTGIFK